MTLNYLALVTPPPPRNISPDVAIQMLRVHTQYILYMCTVYVERLSEHTTNLRVSTPPIEKKCLASTVCRHPGEYPDPPPYVDPLRVRDAEGDQVFPPSPEVQVWCKYVLCKMVENLLDWLAPASSEVTKFVSHLFNIYSYF